MANDEKGEFRHSNQLCPRPLRVIQLFARLALQVVDIHIGSAGRCSAMDAIATVRLTCISNQSTCAHATQWLIGH